jgi:hypothetical protein
MGAARHLPPKAAGAVHDVKSGSRVVNEMFEERLSVSACWCQDRDDMTGVGDLNVIAGSTVVPQEPVLLRGDSPGSPH